MHVFSDFVFYTHCCLPHPPLIEQFRPHCKVFRTTLKRRHLYFIEFRMLSRIQYVVLFDWASWRATLQLRNDDQT